MKLLRALALSLLVCSSVFAQTTALLPTPQFRAFDNNGYPLAGGFVYTYAAGTTTPLATYTSSTGLAANTNPIVLDSTGAANIWLSPALAYKIAVQDAGHVALYTTDNVSIYGGGVSGTNGAALVTYLGVPTGSVSRTVATKLGETISAKDFGAKGDGSTNDTTAIQAAFNSSSSTVHFTPGAYVCSAGLVWGSSAMRAILDPGADLSACALPTGDATHFVIDNRGGGALVTLFSSATLTDLTNAIATVSAAGGGIVRLFGGLYNLITTSPLAIPAKVNLECNGTTIKNTVLHGGVLSFSGSFAGVRGCTLIASAGAPVAAVSTSSGVAVLINSGAAYVKVRDNDISGHEVAGVMLSNATHAVIDHNYFHDGTVSTAFTNWTLQPHEIYAPDIANDSEITYNVLLSYNDIGIGLEPYVTSGSTNNNNLVAFNRVENKNAYAMVLYGKVNFSTQTVAHNQITHNFVKNISSRAGSGGFGAGSNQGGFCVYNAVGDYTDIIDNYCESTMLGRTGVSLPLGSISSADGVSPNILDNRIIASGYDGIWASNNNIADAFGSMIARNRIEGAAQTAILVQNSPRAIVQTNVIKSPGAQCVFADANSLYAKIDHNNCASSASTGMQIFGPYSNVTDNTVEAAANSGYQIVGNNSILRGNIARNNSQAAAGVSSGFQLSGTSGLFAQGNIAFDDQGTHTQSYGFVESNTYAAGTLNLVANSGTGNVNSLFSIGVASYGSYQNTGLLDASLNGITTVASQTATVARFTHGGAAPVAACVAGAEIFMRQDAGFQGLYACTATNTWTRVSP